MPSSPIGLDTPRRTGAIALLAAGAIGAAFGVRYATWQWAVELAQVTASVVHYPPEAPASALHWHLWSLLDQIIAVLLRAGVSERALSWGLSALAGAISAQALAMLTFALTRRTAPALLVPLLLMSVDLTPYGASYPVMLVGLPHTYGMIGLSLAMLSVGLIGSGWWRSGGCLAGLAIAVQLPTGGAVFVCLLIAWLWQRPPIVRGLPVALAAGLGVSLLSYAIFVATRSPIPHVSVDTAHRFLVAFVRFWDDHRMPVDWRSRGVALDLAVLAVAGVWLVSRGPRAVDGGAQTMLRTLVLAAAVSVPLAALTWIDPARLPDAIVAAMPGRLMNIAVFAAGPVLASAAFCVLQRADARRTGMVTTVTWLAIAATATLSIAFPLGRRVAEPTRLRTSDGVWSAAAARDGTLLTSADTWLAQLRTRRPVLLEGATLDTLPYALDAAPGVERILREVYDQSLIDPPPDAGRRGQVASRTSREAWERYEAGDWARIRRNFGVTDVLTPGDWPLRLPVVAASPDLRLYSIPPN